MKLLIRQTTLVTVNEKDEVLEQADLAIVDDKIAAIGEIPEDFVPDRILEGQDGIVLPGLVNSHTHLSMTLMRNYADDLDFWPWLMEWIKPLEDHLTLDDVRIGARLGLAELIRGGTTCFHDMYFHLDQVAEEVEAAGLRACLCETLFDNAGQGEQMLRDAVELHQHWDGQAEGRIRVAMGPHSIYLCSPGYLREILQESLRLQCGWHTHLCETVQEVENCRQQHGKTPVQLLADLDCFEVPVVAAHGIYVDEQDQRLLREGKVSIAHNPSSNLKLANGIAPIQSLLHQGVNVCLGTDGTASNNNLNLFEEIHLAALLQKWKNQDAKALPASEVLRMATIRGAQALGLDHQIGSLEVGKQADLIMINTSQPHLTPRHDPIALLVYSAQASDVCTVMVNGKILLEDHVLQTLDQSSLLEQASQQTQQLLQRAQAYKPKSTLP
ncbi:MAG: amidohydrolase [Deltaproteobacteria bacterium]|nr:amidohydrolase [Deltaproteobacteria bacterium]